MLHICLLSLKAHKYELYIHYVQGTTLDISDMLEKTEEEGGKGDTE